jgi:membrane-associated phospholipid phosphatase
MIAALVLGVLLPSDRETSRALRGFFDTLGGDPKRELIAVQQFGQFSATLIAMMLVWRLDPARRRAILAWLAGLVIAFANYQPMKMLVGRPRPKFDDPWTFLGPLGQYPVSPSVGVRHAWEFWAGISSDLWSMPSSHTAAAMVMATILGRLYPRIMLPMLALAGLVGVMRVMTGAHYASDVAVGAIIGHFAAGRAWAWTMGGDETPRGTRL